MQVFGRGRRNLSDIFLTPDSAIGNRLQVPCRPKKVPGRP